jgi:phosphomannomutase
MTDLNAQTRRWIDADPDPETQAELRAILERADRAELAERMHAPLEFGTAGLRGLVGAGLARMNRAVVIRATRGFADWLLANEPDAKRLPVVLGYDARLSSRQFAEDTAGVLTAAGIGVRYFEEPVPTPLVAYAARQLAAVGAVVVTASHNPPEYNGYKVYASNAAQIISPVDREIADWIERVGPANRVERAEGALAGGHALAEPVPAALFDRYLAELDAARPAGAADRDFGIVFTPMHGVAGKFVERALAHAGYARVHPVAEQSAPDGRFPTVRFPNPEEPGALDLALALAEKENAELVLANDPDGDRLAVCVPSVARRWVQLTGNQVGVLLADYMLSGALRVPTPVVISSIVSSPMLGSIAKEHGAHFEQTLTGFNWIANAALELEQSAGVRFCFGYEEALGYSVGRIVRDKDGVSAAVLFADLVARARAGRRNVLDELHRLYRRHGLWVSIQKSITRTGTEGLSQIERAMQTLGSEQPSELARRAVTGWTDFRSGAEQRPRWLGTANMLGLDLAGGGRVLVRPSGTEPKLKIYVDLCVNVGAEESVQGREEAARSEARAIADALSARLGFD